MLKQTREIMERQVSQKVHLVNDLLDISRITTGRLALRPERVELRSIVDNALETVATHLASAMVIVPIFWAPHQPCCRVLGRRASLMTLQLWPL